MVHFVEVNWNSKQVPLRLLYPFNIFFEEMVQMFSSRNGKFDTFTFISCALCDCASECKAKLLKQNHFQ